MRKLSLLLALLFITLLAHAQERVVRVSTSDFHSHQRLFLAPLDGWIFRKGNDPNWAKGNIDFSKWAAFKPTELNTDLADENGRVEGWFRIKIVLDESLQGMPLAISRDLWAATDVYLDGELVHSFGNTGRPYEAFNPILKYPKPVELIPGREYLLAIHVVDYETTFTQREIRLKPKNLESFINLTGPDYIKWVTRDFRHTHVYVTLCLAVSFLLCFLYWFLVYLNPDQKIFRIIAWYTTVVLIGAVVFFAHTFFEITYGLEKVRFLLFITFQGIITLFGLFILEWVLTRKISKFSWILLIIILILNFPAHLFSISQPFAVAFTIMLFHFGRNLFAQRKQIKGANWAIVAAVVVPTAAIIVLIILHSSSLDLYNEYDKPLLSLQILSPPLFYLAYISVRFKETLSAVRIESQKLVQVTEEKRVILANQNTLLEAQVQERTRELKSSLENLKSTQAQLIQSEKMASLGELTAGIAHEIQNPLNFVNNFSEVSSELVDETLEEVEGVKTRHALSQKNNLSQEQGPSEDSTSLTEITDLLGDIKSNLDKITHHGKRADAIVKGMLAHSRKAEGEKQLTDLNALADEYLKLAYHGMRAKDKNFYVQIETEFDATLPLINVIPQDIGRVLLNMINNAFYAAHTQDAESVEHNSPPSIKISTKNFGDKIEIAISDNGPGIPESIKDKIFQPFFTTKKGTEGTGLGLSLSYDIVKAHGGTIELDSQPGSGATFTISLPANKTEVI